MKSKPPKLITLRDWLVYVGANLNLPLAGYYLDQKLAEPIQARKIDES